MELAGLSIGHAACVVGMVAGLAYVAVQRKRQREASQPDAIIVGGAAASFILCCPALFQALSYSDTDALSVQDVRWQLTVGSALILWTLGKVLVAKFSDAGRAPAKPARPRGEGAALPRGVTAVTSASPSTEAQPTTTPPEASPQG